MSLADDRKFLIQAMRKYLLKGKTISDSDCIYHDLRIAGDDASELLQEVNEYRRIDWTGLKFQEYFSNDNEDSVIRILSWFGYRDKIKRCTVGHLLQVMQAGRWFEPEQS